MGWISDWPRADPAKMPRAIKNPKSEIRSTKSETNQNRRGRGGAQGRANTGILSLRISALSAVRFRISKFEFRILFMVTPFGRSGRSWLDWEGPYMDRAGLARRVPQRSR